MRAWIPRKVLGRPGWLKCTLSKRSSPQVGIGCGVSGLSTLGVSPRSSITRPRLTVMRWIATYKPNKLWTGPTAMPR
ncbi:hypothetical protein D3C81_2083180 [compost metagenome]